MSTEQERQARLSGGAAAASVLMGYTSVALWYRMSRDNAEAMPVASLLLTLFIGLGAAMFAGRNGRKNGGWIGVPYVLLIFVATAMAALLGLVVGT